MSHYRFDPPVKDRLRDNRTRARIMVRSKVELLVASGRLGDAERAASRITDRATRGRFLTTIKRRKG